MPSQQSSITLSLLISIISYLFIYGIFSTYPHIFSIWGFNLTMIHIINGCFMGIITLIAMNINKVNNDGSGSSGSGSGSTDTLLHIGIETIRNARSKMTVFHWIVLILFIYLIYFRNTR